MLPFILRALHRKAWTLLIVSIVSFAVVHLAPGSPSQIDPMNPRFTREQLERYRAAFDLDSVSLSLGADYMLTPATLISLGYTHRKGDVVSSTRRNRQIFVVSEAIAPDPAFGPGVIAYRLDARSHIFELGLSHAIGSRLSANLGVARSLTYGRGGNDYYGSRVSASLLYSF